MTDKTIGFIGAGNMASSLISGLLHHEEPPHIWASCPDVLRLEELANEHSALHTTQHNQMTVNACDVLVLAIKPQVFKTVCEQIAENVQSKNPIVISVAAGITLTQMKKWLGYEGPMIRTMPNTPALLGAGATGLYANEYCQSDAKDIAEEIFTGCGIACWVESEEQLNTVTALSGSGPAYFFAMVEHMITAATDLGLPRSVSLQLAHQTILGAGTLLNQAGADASTLRQQVTSPNGTTAAGLDMLDKLKFDKTIRETLQAAYERSIALSAAND